MTDEVPVLRTEHGSSSSGEAWASRRTSRQHGQRGPRDVALVLTGTGTPL